MNKKLLAAIAALALLAGCATPGYQTYGSPYGGQPQYAGYTQYPAQPQHTAQYGDYPQYAGAAPANPCPEVNGGHIIGGIAGALLGAQIGKGNGRTAAAAVGAVTGALAGGSLGRDPACR